MTVTCSPLSSDPSFPSARIDSGAFRHNFDRSSSPLASTSHPPSDDDSDDEDEDEDEDDYNLRVVPNWPVYCRLFESYGYHLDTYKDVRQFYLRYWETRNIQQNIQSCAGYRSACGEDRNDNDLCKDEGLVSLLTLKFFHPPLSPVYRDHGCGKLTSTSFPTCVSDAHSSCRFP